MKDSPLFASYTKYTEATVVTIVHRVRLKVGSSARDVASALNHVPPHCTLHEVIGDQDHEDFEYCGEMVFKEEMG